MFDDHHRIEHHADTDEENNRKGISQRKGFHGCSMGILGFTHHHAGEEGTQSKGHMEDFSGAEGNTDGHCQYAKRKEFAGTGFGNLPEEVRQQTAPDHQHQYDKDDNLSQGYKQKLPERLRRSLSLACEH